jgi:Tfp pilus assembly protein PilP
MLAHHRGAVAMSDIALANGANGALRAQIEETRAEQIEEVAMVEAMLRGEPIAMQPQATTTPAAAPAAARSAAPKTASVKPTPAKAAAPKPSPESAAEPDASPTCAPEHREAGHC